MKIVLSLLVQLIQGETDIEQLAIVLQTLGTPTEESWPGMKNLPDYIKITFPNYPGLPWSEILPDSDDGVIDFVKIFLCYNPKNRATAEQVNRTPKCNKHNSKSNILF